MRRRKVGFLILFFLISFVSFAFASITIFLPLEKNQSQTLSEFHVPSEIKAKPFTRKHSAYFNSSLSYQAWRHIQASA